MDIPEAVVAVLTTGMVIGFPMMALSLRFAVKPALETWLKVREASGRPSAAQLAECSGS